MLVAKKDAQGNPVLDAAGQPVYEEDGTPPIGGQAGATTETISRADAERLSREAVERARAEEKRKLNGELEIQRNARKELEDKLAANEKAARDAEIARLPIEQQVTARMTQMERDLAAERGARIQTEANANHQIRQIGLVAYRERVLRAVPEDVHHLVVGDSEEAMDASADQAIKTYNDLENRLRTKLTAEIRTAPPGGQPLVPAPPPNPAYVAPAPPGGGLPSVTNPIPVTEGTQGPPAEMRELTTEQAVRSGRYGGEMREKLHAQIRGNMRYSGTIGSAPRHWSGQPPAQMPVHEQPGGVQQPQGTPMGPARQAGMVQQPSPQPQAAPPPGQPPPAGGGDPRAAAREAIARTHAGGNMTMGDNPLAAQALTAAQNFANQRGIASPEAAFAQRFTHTPPVTGGQ